MFESHATPPDSIELDGEALARPPRPLKRLVEIAAQWCFRWRHRKAMARAPTVISPLRVIR